VIGSRASAIPASRIRAAIGAARPLVFILALAPPAAAAPCAPAARVRGDRDAVARVDAELAKLGVAVDVVAAGCPAPLEAAVQLDPAGLAVAVSDASHHSEGRVVGDALVAAQWIDSWLRDPLDPWRVLTADPAASGVVLTPAETPGVAASVSPSRSQPLLDRLSVAADYEQTFTTDGSTWQGASVAACLRFHAACFGLRGRYAEQTIASGVTAADRTAVDEYATAAVTLKLGTMELSPELDVGVGELLTSRVDGCAVNGNGSNNLPLPPPPCVPTNGGGPIYFGDHFAETTVGPRAAATLRVAIPLAGPVWLDGVAAATVIPFAHTAPFASPTNPPGTIPSQTALPGEPEVAFQLGIGLRVEAR
jgi:hypothetical protein